MIRFSMTNDQKDIVDLTCQILEKELAPQLAKLDEESKFPMDVYEKMVEARLYAMEVPEKYGGMGGSTMRACF